MTTDREVMRAAFEKWHRKNYISSDPLEWDEDGYTVFEHNMAWKSWQAAIAQLEAALAAPVEPVGYFVLSTGLPGMEIAPTWLQVAEGREAEGQPLYAAPVHRVICDEEISRIWDDHIVPVFGKNGINPIVFARAIIAKAEGK